MAKGNILDRMISAVAPVHAAKQYTVYAGELPEELTAFIQKHPEAGALVVPVERFAETRRKLEQAGTAQAILYRKIKSIS